MNKYNQQFYNDLQQGSIATARKIVPIIINYVKPKSVIDVGCGNGTWLSIFRENGIEDVFGIDGNHVNTDTLLFPKTKYYSANLENSLNLGRQFDLAVSLEVAEHVSPSKVEIYITTLTNLAPVILFSAAIPGQKGIHHVNEQWPEYWEMYFSKKNYCLIDCIRNKIWNDEEVPYWYAQNSFLFVNNKYIINNSLLLKLRAEYALNNHMLSIVHPKLYSRVMPNLLNHKYAYTQYLIKSIKNIIQK